MMHDMTSSGRVNGNAKHHDSSSWIHDWGDVQATPTGQTYSVFPQDNNASPVMFSNSYVPPKTDLSYVKSRRPALISPSPEDASSATTATTTRATSSDHLAKIHATCPGIPSEEELLEKSNSDARMLEPVPKRVRVDGASAFSASDLRCLPIVASLFQQNNDERVNRAASVLTLLRRSSISTIDSKEGEHDDDTDLSLSSEAEPGLRLALPQDAQFLNSLHCFVRSQLLEVFEKTRNDTKKTRVGLRCIFCTHQDNKSTMASFYPKSLMDIYRTVCTWQRVHFQTCTHIPKDVKETYKKIKAQDRSRGKTKYWVTSAQQVGLMDMNHERGGICFAPA